MSLDLHEFSATNLKFLEAQMYLFINNKLALNITSSFTLLIVTKLSFEVSLIMNLRKKHNDYPGSIIHREKKN